VSNGGTIENELENVAGSCFDIVKDRQLYGEKMKYHKIPYRVGWLIETKTLRTQNGNTNPYNPY
jgi:hypothetical protein